MLPRCHGFFGGLQDAGAEITSSPLGCPETIFEVTRDPNKKKPTHLPRVFFFFSHPGGGLSGSISNEDESIILFVYVAFRLVTCC